MKKAKSSFDLAHQPPRRTPSADIKVKNPLKYQSSVDLHESKGDGKHKVVIYFSDAYNNICNKADENIDRHRSAMVDVQPKAQQSSSKEFMAQLKTVLEEKSKFTNKFADRNIGVPANKFKPPVPEKPSSSMLQINQSSSSRSREELEVNGKSSQKLLPSFIESIDENNVIKLKIEQNFRRASELVDLISSLPKKNGGKKVKRNERCGHDTSSIHELNFSHEGEMDCIDEICSEDDSDEDAISEPDEGYFYDWSFVQEWRSR